MLLDISPLHTNPAFRRLWTSSMITRFGAMVTYVAAPYQIKELTGSYVAVGLLGAVELVPIVIFGLYGGALADRLDRVRLATTVELTLAACTALLCINATRADPSIIAIYLLAVVMAGADALQRPSLDALLPRLVSREQLPAASALNSLTHNVSFILGTAIGGLLVVSAGPAVSYAVDSVTYLVSAALLVGLPSLRPARVAAESTWEQLTSGVRYAASRRDLMGTYAIDTVAMVLAFPNALFPFLADRLGSPESLGLLYSAGAIGAAIATATSRWTQNVTRYGWAIILAASAWGAAIALAGSTTSLLITLVALGLAGAADMISGLFRSLMWNLTIPDELRGRLAGIELLSYSLGPQFGQVRASASAQFFGLQRALVSGGIACVCFVAATAAALPALRNFRHSLDHASK